MKPAFDGLVERNLRNSFPRTNPVFFSGKIQVNRSAPKRFPRWPEIISRESLSRSVHHELPYAGGLL